MTFTADYPGAIVFPCHPTNQLGPPNAPKGWCLHTPEEPADGYPSTPHWFAQEHPDRAGSTHYFVSYTGEIYQCVSEASAPIANGVLGKPYPAWADPRVSLNRQTLSVEIEGYAANIRETLVVGSVQWDALVRLVKNRATAYGIPLDREHIIGHYEVSIDRSDPGAGFPWDALIAALNEEDDMKPVLAWSGGVYLVTGSSAKYLPTQAVVNEMARTFGLPFGPDGNAIVGVGLSAEALAALR